MIVMWFSRQRRADAGEGTGRTAEDDRRAGAPQGQHEQRPCGQMAAFGISEASFAGCSLPPPLDERIEALRSAR
jgi:Zn-dependent protease with chaperone function